MEISGRQANVVLAVLALAALGTSGYAMWSVRQMPESTAQVSSPTPTSEPRSQPTEEGEASWDTASVTPDDSASATSHTTEQPSETERPTRENEPNQEEQPTEQDDPTLDGWRSAWSGDDADLLVIGDGYSNLESQWVQEWAALQDDSRPTQISHWDEGADDGFNDPIELSEGAGSSLHVWSASRDGTTIEQAADRVGRFVDASAPPQAILISLGGSSGDEDVANELDGLLRRLPEVPVLVAAGPSGLYEPGVADSVVNWAEDNDERVSMVDLREAVSVELTAEEWAQAFEQALGEDD